MYAFLFDKRSLMLCSLGAVAVALLCFAAGLATGARLNLPAFADAVPALPLPDVAVPSALPQPVPSAEPEATGTTDPAGDSQPAPGPGAQPVAARLESPGGSRQPSQMPRMPAAETDRRSYALAAGISPVGATAPPQRAFPRVAGEGSPRSLYGVQVGAYTVRENAWRQVRTLQRRGFPARVHERLRTDGGRWFTVSLGRFEARPEATRLALRLQREEGIQAFVAAEP